MLKKYYTVTLVIGVDLLAFIRESDRLHRGRCSETLLKIWRILCQELPDGDILFKFFQRIDVLMIVDMRDFVVRKYN